MPAIQPQALIDQRTVDTVIVDVRETDEFAAGHVAGSINVPLSELMARQNEVPNGAYIICRTGSRSAMATEFLSGNGHQVTNVLGGVTAWPEDLAL